MTTIRLERSLRMKVKKIRDDKSIRDSLVEELETNSMGMTDQPVLPLVGSENVPISEEEEKDVE